MKKLTKILAALILAASSLVMSGCADEEFKDRLGPNNVWCTYRESQNSTFTDDSSSSVTYYFKYVESTNTLSIAVVPTPGSALATTFDTLAGQNKRGYYLKEYQNGESTDGAEGDDDFSIDSLKTMSQAKWEVFYIAKLTKSSLPANCTPVSLAGVKEKITNFSLKDAIIDALLTSLGL